MEPLNLVKRKNRPVAVVAPSTVVSPPVVAAATAPAAFTSGLLSSLYVNSMLNDQLFQRAAAAAQYGTSFWTPANRFWQVMQQHNSAAQQYAAAAAAAAAVAAATSTTSTFSTTSSTSSSCSTTAVATTTTTTSAAADCKNDRRSVSPSAAANSCSTTVARFVCSVGLYRAVIINHVFSHDVFVRPCDRLAREIKR